MLTKNQISASQLCFTSEAHDVRIQTSPFTCPTTSLSVSEENFFTDAKIEVESTAAAPNYLTMDSMSWPETQYTEHQYNLTNFRSVLIFLLNIVSLSILRHRF